MKILVGTSGWSYKEWRGTFYPAKIKPEEMLYYYAERFPAVEINNSFYRMPGEKVLLDWAAKVPAEFQFVLKAPRKITHIQQLADDDGSLGHFLRTANVLGEQLGATLFQCPPSFKKDLGVLRDFLARVPKTWHAAMEFRHASWLDEEVYDILRAHNVPLVTTEEDDKTAKIVATATWGYLRLRRTAYQEHELLAWVEQIGRQSWEKVFVFFKHDEKGLVGPEAAQRTLSMMEATQ